MRHSEAAVALIRREHEGQMLWLAQWNPKWQRYNFVSGHRRPEETFRECLVRELSEELHLRERADHSTAADPLAHLKYTARSESARAETQYTMELFEVELTDTIRRVVEADPRNCWLSEAEIRDERCGDGKPVSSTMRQLLIRAGLWPEL